ncbi:MAG TPA: tyrosine protein kinase [Baekduia sp.]|nr:tyrosine protein kinase [Baekduia sp.]
MTPTTHPPGTDLLLPLPASGERWDPHTIHTHYFGFSVPEAAIGAFLYVRYQPAFGLSQGGVSLFRGLDNRSVLDVEHLDYEMTMPWPQVDGATITTANGLRIAFLEPGRQAQLTYASPDGAASLDLLATAVTPLLARGHVMPGEEAHHGSGSAAGGSEQFMHVTGELVLHGERFSVDCHAPRDRSWRQVRVERRAAVQAPPVGWSPMWFGEDLVFNQISYEPPDTDPAWTGLYDVPADRPTHHFAWVVADGELRSVTSVRRTVHERHPALHAALRQEVQAVDERGRTYRFHGEAIAMAPIPAWPNAGFCDSVYRWEDDHGRVAHATYQEIWFDTYQRAMAARRRAAVGA